ncbi:hypothetical protein EOS_05595 [Caballeronia mineralivorans PML1(12)]|uniref:Lactate dehydrogenase n=1 Tax=Caballeronia mineralivorans PML1(12) TaxID=908627 RepID=A0A0J1D3B9_9BURK|nr:Ldh family oxidoreductase [Caballeronia mineralivorans]KLU27166.1 hypothetical protein EOS_05595 [Caballeronia mineralivorans PML1(12)]
MTIQIQLTETQARELGFAALRVAGLSDDEAGVITDHVVDAELCGYGYSGLAKLLNLLEHARFRAARSEPTFSDSTGPISLLDGGNHNGMYVMYLASMAAAQRADQFGFAVIGVRNTWMSGRSAYYVDALAKRGLVGIVTVASTPVVAAPGGASPVLGTNPIAFGFPTESDPFVIDMGTSAFMTTEVRYRKRLNIALPEGVALDSQGVPTTDPHAAAEGLLLPFGDHKGFGISLAIHALGMLCNAEPPPPKTGPGALVVAIKPTLAGDSSTYRQTMSRWLQSVKATRTQKGIDEIRLPGERSARSREQAKRHGIDIPKRIVDALTDYASGKKSRGDGQ